MRIALKVVSITRSLNQGAKVTLMPEFSDPNFVPLNSAFWQNTSNTGVVFDNVRDDIAAPLTLGSVFYFDISGA